MKKGFTTIELMIAMAIMVMVLSAVVVVAFGNQSFLIGAQTNAEAMNKAQELLETQQALARKDFNLVNNVSSTTDDIYEKAVYVRLLPDFLTKEVKALISWQGERGLKRELELTTLIANFETPVGGNTCNSNLSGDWANPSIENSITNFATLVGNPGGTYTLSDVDAYKGKLYVTAINTANPTDQNFFIFDIANTSDPDFLSGLDNENGGGTTAVGLSAVRVAEDPASSPVKTYAYAANGYNASYSTCNPVTRRNCGQLNIFDVTDSSNPVWGTNLMLASSTAPFVTGPQASGNSLYYKNGYLLLGLNSTGSGNGPEFHLIDVHNPDDLFGGSHLLFPVGTYAVNNTVNAIVMRGIYAYIATPNSQELQILDMTNPSSIVVSGNYGAGNGNGKSLHIVGNNVYLGRTTGAGTDIQILDNTNPTVTLPLLGGIDIEPPTNSVNAVIVRDYLSFLLTNSGLRIYNTSNPASPALISAYALPQSGSATEPSMDCEDNRLYVISNDGIGRGFLYVIKPGP